MFVVLIGSTALLLAALLWILQVIFQNDADDVPLDFINKLGNYGRQLGAHEEFYVYENKYISLYDSNTLIVESKVPLSEDIVLRSLGCIWKRHPLLRCKIVVLKNSAGRKAHFFKEISPEPKLDFKINDSSEWLPVVYQELKKKFKLEDGPLWRIQMLKPEKLANSLKYSFIFTFQHCIVDGSAIIQIFREFTQNLELILSGSEPQVESLPLLPCLEELFREELNITLFDQLKYFFATKMINPFSANPSTTELSRDLVKTFKVDKARCTQLYPIQFDEEETAMIIKAGKTRGVRVHSVCTAAAAVALRHLLNKYDIKKHENINLSTACAMTLRNVEKGKKMVGMGAMGLYVSMVLPKNLYLLSDTSKNAFWEMAGRYHVSLYQSIQKDVHFQMVKTAKLGKYLSEEAVAASQVSQDDCNRPIDIVFSNRGNHTILASESGEKMLKILGTYTGIGTTPHDYFCNLGYFITTINGRMSWTLQYRSQLMENDVAAELAKLVKSTILDNCME